MAYYGDSEVISGVGKGTAETEFTGATYRATVTCSAKTGPEAKNKAIPIMQKVREAIETHAKRGGLDTGKVKTTFSVDVEHQRGTGEFCGYRAVWTCKFTGSVVREAPVVHDALTSIEGVQAPTPTYQVDDSVEVHGRAFTAGVKKAQAKFQAECAALGLSPSDYVVQSWTTQDDEARGHGKTLSYSAPASESIKAVGLEPGKASLDLNVTLAYVRHPSSKHSG